MIPKRIITTWIHDERNPYEERHRQLFTRCLSSWKKHLPDYEVRIVTRENLFAFAFDSWVEDRMMEGNFIGASQWARLIWLQQMGGVYLDMDVEVVKPFDPLLDAKFFVGRQKDGFINNAVMGSVAGHPFLGEQLAYIKMCDPKDPQFGNETGPRMLTKLLPRPDVRVHPAEAFYPYHWDELFSESCVTDKTYAVHRWASTWWPPKEMTA